MSTYNLGFYGEISKIIGHFQSIKTDVCLNFLKLLILSESDKVPL